MRVSVVGNSGSGKSSLAGRLADVLDAPYVELDAIHHMADWTPIDPDEFLARVGTITQSERWVIDGNHRSVVVEGPVWDRADTVVWLDLARRTVMRQIIGRTIRRVVRREELWNGNRERLANALAWDPDQSVIRWAWTQHRKYRDRYGAAATAPQHAHIEFIRLTSRRAVDQWLEGITRCTCRR
jgi:adenylate kinase family enzyme